MQSESPEQRKKDHRGARLIIALTLLLFIVFIFFRIFFEESIRISPVSVKSNALIFVLWILIILFSLTLLFILLRNLLKIYYEKNREHVGRGFKNRLVFFFTAFSIVPSILLFFFATDMISRSIEPLFKPQIEMIIQNVGVVKDNYYNTIWTNLDHFAKQISAMIQEKRMYTDDNRVYLSNKLKEKMVEYKLDMVSVYRGSDELVSVINPLLIQEYKDFPLEILYQGLSESGVRNFITMSKGELIYVGTSTGINPQERILTIIGRYLPENYSSVLNSLSTMVANYTQQKELKDPVRNTYILLFLFITILIVFAASWLGYFLAKGITVPIEKLAAATSEIVKGNLDVQIDYPTHDEFSLLITEFNRMALDLKENRDKLTRRTVELKHRRSVFEHILKNITTGVMALNSQGEIIEMNPEAARMLSLDAAASRKKHFSASISETLYPDIHSLISRAYETRFKKIEKEVDIKVKGTVSNLAVKITQLRNPINNRFSGLLVVLTELTELIRAQRLLVWREVAKRVAHEIKNPLTPIQISSQRILRSFEQPDDKFRAIVEDSLNIISQELDSIKKLADEFSNFARLPEMKFGQGDINLILENLVSVYNSIYKNLILNVKLDVNLPSLLKVDAEQIKRVFVNLIDNAIEAVEKEGLVEIQTRYNEQSKFVAIEIADNGPGISDEDKLKLFIPYFSKKSTGTGLGLAIAHNIIEEHNGLISIVDNQPKGARFIIELPV